MELAPAPKEWAPAYMELAPAFMGMAPDQVEPILLLIRAEL